MVHSTCISIDVLLIALFHDIITAHLMGQTINSYKTGILLMGHRQTEKPQNVVNTLCFEFGKALKVPRKMHKLKNYKINILDKGK